MKKKLLQQLFEQCRYIQVLDILDGSSTPFPHSQEIRNLESNHTDSNHLDYLNKMFGADGKSGLVKKLIDFKNNL